MYALVANINATYFGVGAYSSIEEKAVAYMYFIIKDHPFIDGNKRTAVVTFKAISDINNLRFSSKKYFSLDLFMFAKLAKSIQRPLKLRSSSLNFFS